MMASTRSLAVTPGRSFWFTLMAKVCGLALQDALGREDMAHLGGADAEGQRPESPVGAGVAVAADNRAPRTRQSQFRTDDVHDAAQLAVHVQQFNAGLGAVALQLLNLPAAAVATTGTPPKTCSVRVGVE